MMLSLTTIMIKSEDPSALGAFYTKVLGAPGRNDGDYVGWQAGNGMLMIGRHSNGEEPIEMPGRVVVTFETGNVKGEFDRLKALGATVQQEPYQPGQAGEMWLAGLADPDGNYLQLQSPKPTQSQSQPADQRPMSQRFAGLTAVFINCSIKRDRSGSHTQLLMDKAAAVMRHEGVDVEQLYAREHAIAVGMVKDGADEGAPDDWPQIQAKIILADILVIGTPIWLGAMSSVTSLVIERMYAYSGDRNAQGQYLYYGKTAGCVITGNEDGIKHCARDILYAMQHIGYMIPPQADCGWIGEAGPGPSYGDTEWADKPIGDGMTRLGFDNDFTNRNTTFMSWNLMHTAAMLKERGGIPPVGNTTDGWQHVSHVSDENPEYR